MCDPGSNFGESHRAAKNSDRKICNKNSGSEALNACPSKKRKLDDEAGSVEIIELGEYDDTHEFKQELFDGEIEEIESNADIKQENLVVFMEHSNEHILAVTPEAKQELAENPISDAFSAKTFFCHYLCPYIQNVLLAETNISLRSNDKKETDCDEILNLFMLHCAIAVTDEKHTDMQPNVSLARRGIMKQYGIVGTWPNKNRCQMIKTHLR